MRKPETKIIDWVNDLSQPRETSELIQLAQRQKAGKIKVWEIRSAEKAPQYVVVIFEIVGEPAT